MCKLNIYIIIHRTDVFIQRDTLVYCDTIDMKGSNMQFACVCVHPPLQLLNKSKIKILRYMKCAN